MLPDSVNDSATAAPVVSCGTLASDARRETAQPHQPLGTDVRLRRLIEGPADCCLILKHGKNSNEQQQQWQLLLGSWKFRIQESQVAQMLHIPKVRRPLILDLLYQTPDQLYSRREWDAKSYPHFAKKIDTHLWQHICLLHVALP